MANTKYKTKFPMARIKKIMQVDDEIGKVSQTTPIVISKALELFLEKMVQNAASSLEPGNTKIALGVMKRLILSTEEYDFLRQVASRLPDYQPPAEPSSPQKRPRTSTRRVSKLHSDNVDNDNGPMSGTDTKDSVYSINAAQSEEYHESPPKKRNKMEISAIILHDDSNSD